MTECSEHPILIKCTKCKMSKEITEFPKCTGNKKGHLSRCKLCVNQINKEFRRNNLEKVKNARKKYYQANLFKNEKR